MSDDATGQPLAEQVAAPQVEPAPAPQIPPKFEGKPLEEVVKSYAELEKLSGRQAEELGNLKNELSYLRGMVEQRATPEPAPPPEVTQEFDWQNPGRYMDAYFEKRWAAKEKELQEKERLRDVQQARTNYDEGKDAAYRLDRRLFEGIEREVEQAVFDSYKSGILNSASLRNPKTWTTTAAIMRYERGQVDRLMPAAPKPVTPTATEVPTAAKPQTDEDTFELNPELREEAQKWGLSEKEAQEAMKAGYTAMQEGRLRRRS